MSKGIWIGGEWYADDMPQSVQNKQRFKRFVNKTEPDDTVNLIKPISAALGEFCGFVAVSAFLWNAIFNTTYYW